MNRQARWAERRNEIRSDRLVQKRGRDRVRPDRSRNRLLVISVERKLAVVTGATTRETALLPAHIEEVSRDCVISLDEKDDFAAAGQITFVKASLAFLGKCRNCHRSQSMWVLITLQSCQALRVLQPGVPRSDPVAYRLRCEAIDRSSVMFVMIALLPKPGNLATESVSFSHQYAGQHIYHEISNARLF